MKSIMNNQFSTVPNINIQRSSFDRSHGLKTTFDSGYLVPIFVDEALPGDTFNLEMSGFSRLSTPIFPIMDNMKMETFFFAVPYRLVWDNWQKFNGEQTDPGDSTDFLVPTMTSPPGGYANESLSDYFGIPTKVANIDHSSLFHRAYNLIYNEWFRSENLQDSVVVNTSDTSDDPADYVLLRRAKRHDYFTSCLPWPQKGDSVDLPLGSSAPVTSTGDAIFLTDSVESNYTVNVNSSGYLNRISTTPGLNLRFGGQTGLEADLTSATSATINQLREAFQVQKLLERDARGGTRYIEIIKSHFGVTSPDARLQRPEYLGGGSSFVNISPIAQTSSTDSTSPQGNLSAMATASLHNHGFSKSFTEHNLIIGLVNVRADLTYQQGLNRMFSRSTRYDFFWPAFAHLGEQAVLNKEIYAQGTSADDDVFGYQERFAEMRYKPSLVTGKFRSNDAQTLDAWHLAQDYSSLPALNADWIVDKPPLERCLAVTDEPQFIFDGYFKLRCARPMPLTSVPGLIDHF